jgi:hypothetical protein
LDEYIAKFIEDNRMLNPDAGKGGNWNMIIIIVIIAVIGYFGMKSFGLM